MSGVFGCWHLDARPLDATRFHRSLAGISPHGSREIHTWIDGSIGLGDKISTPTVGATNASTIDRTICVFDGRLDNRAELRRTLHDHPRADSGTDRDLVAAAYERFGDAFVERLEGDFALAVFDRRMNRLLLARDRVGLRPLCYVQRGGAFLFASEAKALLAHAGITAMPDEQMLAEFLLYFPSQDMRSRTFFAGILSVPPAHLLIATPRSVSVRRYFDFDTEHPLRLDAFQDYVAAFHDLFVAAVRNRLRSPHPVAISISGGLDSAYIACAAGQLARDEPGLPAVLGINYSGPAGTPSDEHAYVHAIEQATGMTIARVDQRAGFLECAGDEAWQSESPMVETLARQAQAGLRAVRDAGAARFLTGHWGDQMLCDSDYLLDLVRSGRWPSARRHAAGWGLGVRRLALRCAREIAARRLPTTAIAAVRRARGRRDGAWRAPWFTPHFQRVLRERAAHAQPIAIGGTHHARAIYRQARLAYHVQCMEWNARIGAMHGVEMAFPYLDAALLQFLMRIPGDVQSHGGVPRGLMRAAMRGTVPSVIIDRRSKGEFTHLANASIDHDFAAMREILGPTALSVQFGYVDGPALWQRLDQWRAEIRRSHDTLLTTRIVNLCGVELFLRRFFGAGSVASTIAEPAMAAC